MFGFAPRSGGKLGSRQQIVEAEGREGRRGEEKPFEIPSTDNTDNKHTTSRAFVTTTVNLFLKTPFSVFSPSV